MQTKQWTTVDKSEWNRGAWDSEPDKMQWQDEDTGMPCFIVRGPSGALCGYVGVSEAHLFHGKNYDDICTKDGKHIDVHGGLTFADRCQPTEDESRHICHTPDEGDLDNVWWFGFDCAHIGDLCPSYSHRVGDYGYDTYKTLAYVKSQVRYLARQLAEVGVAVEGVAK